eukprot:1277178-Amphidinium_carterae.1
MLQELAKAETIRIKARQASSGDGASTAPSCAAGMVAEGGTCRATADEAPALLKSKVAAVQNASE